MAAPAKGLFYEPSPAPQSGELPAIRQWAGREFDRIANAMREGRSQSLRVDVWGSVPPRPFAGLVVYFVSGVVGASEGLYEYRGDGAWHKL